MQGFLYAVYFFVGACFMSCGNCIYYRVQHGEDWVRGRSHCDGCGKPLHFWELVPVLSCLALRGKCPKCGYFFGYHHADTEFTGGAMAVLCTFGFDDIWHQVVRLSIFGVLYCGMSWVTAQKD